MDTINNFIIKDDTLTEYVGNETEVTIPNSVNKVGEYAFYDCKNLTTVFMPESVTTIGKSAFKGCKKTDRYFHPQWS